MFEEDGLDTMICPYHFLQIGNINKRQSIRNMSNELEVLIGAIKLGRWIFLALLLERCFLIGPDMKKILIPLFKLVF
jgi:hypothetical protein